MQDGFLKVSAHSPNVNVADLQFNAKQIELAIDKAVEAGAKILVLPELCLTGYTVADLFFSTTLLKNVRKYISQLSLYTAKKDILVFVGAPLDLGGKLYNTAVAMFDGRILAVIPKANLSSSLTKNETRYFSSGRDINTLIYIDNKDYPFCANLILEDIDNNIKIGVEISDELFALEPKNINLAKNGANIICNLSCTNEIIGMANFRRKQVEIASLKCICAYIFSDAGNGESTTDYVFGGQKLIAENGNILAESCLFEETMTSAIIDIGLLDGEKRKFLHRDMDINFCSKVNFKFESIQINDVRNYSKTPFLPSDNKELSERAELVLSMQSHALAKRITFTKTKKLVIGISGGLDSTLALLVALRATRLSGLSKTDIIGVTMPCFGTSNRTFNNSLSLAKGLGITFKQIDIAAACTRHLQDIGHDGVTTDAAYENAQARERTQVLMDTANMVNGLVIGTGDLSELALGFATYNGDHMSMYGVNGSVPKTLIRALIIYEGNNLGKEMLDILTDITNTPISPELKPTEKGQIKQITEEVVGPYVLHDFFLYYTIRYGFSIGKIANIAYATFKDDYTKKEVNKWLKIFVSRFFSQQFKRSCLPDGVKIGTVSLSPRGDWCMPSDASSAIWLEEIDKLID